MNWYKTAQNNEMYFLRYTSDPIGDLERGWSCNVHSWAWDYDGVKRYYEHFDIPKERQTAKHDKKNDIWCVRPEAGLSSFAFWDSNSFNDAKKEVSGYFGFGSSKEKSTIAVFSSSDYQLGKGSDREDIFIGGFFVGYIYPHMEWDDFTSSLKQNSFEKGTATVERENIKNNTDMFVEDDIDMFVEK